MSIAAGTCAALLSYFLPGYLVARAMRARDPVSSGIVLSLLLLFWSVVTLDAIGQPVSPGPVVGVQALVSAVALVYGRKARPQKTEWPSDRSTWLPLAVAAVVAALLVLRCTLQPVAFVDDFFRWDFLARHLLLEPTLAYYPPVTPADFTHYPYPDGIPPVISLAYWTMYAALGHYAPGATGVFVGLMYVGTSWTVYRLASAYYGPVAGALSVTVLVSSRAFLSAVGIGQETGLTSFAVMAMALAIETAVERERRDRRVELVLAGAAAGLGALAREYMLAFIAGGVCLVLVRRLGVRAAVLFTLSACVVSLPWYFRNWLHTGNPLYDNPVGGMFVGNPYHTAMYDFHRQFWNAHINHETVIALVTAVVKDAALPITLGAAGAALAFRRCGPLLGLVALDVALYLASVPLTAAGPSWATRVLAPAWALLSVTAGGVLARIPAGRARWIAALAIAGWTTVMTLPAALLWPSDPAQVPMQYWPQAALFARDPTPTKAAELSAAALKALPPDAVLMSDDCSILVVLIDQGRPTIPAWSPRLAFLYLPALSGDEALRRLRDAGVRGVVAGRSGQDTNREFYNNFPFWREALDRLPVAAESRGSALYLLP